MQLNIRIPAPPLFLFTANLKVNFDVDSHVNLLQFFKRFFDFSLIKHIVPETDIWISSFGKNHHTQIQTKWECFSNNEEIDETAYPTSKLNKSWHVYNNLVTKFQKLCTPEEKVTSDESIFCTKSVEVGFSTYPSRKPGLESRHTCSSKPKVELCYLHGQKYFSWSGISKSSSFVPRCYNSDETSFGQR